MSSQIDYNLVLQNFFRTNLLTILTYTEMATTAEATYPLAMINEVSKLIR